MPLPPIEIISSEKSGPVIPTIRITEAKPLPVDEQYSAAKHDIKSTFSTIAIVGKFIESIKSSTSNTDTIKIEEGTGDLLISLKEYLNKFDKIYSNYDHSFDQIREAKENENSLSDEQKKILYQQKTEIFINEVNEIFNQISPIVDENKGNDSFSGMIRGQANSLREQLKELPIFLEFDNYQVNLEEVNVYNLINKKIEKIKEERTYPHNFNIHCDNQNTTENLDVFLTDKIIENFVYNAMKYSSSEKPVQVDIKSTPDNELVISVKDFGIGLSSEQLNKMKDLNTGKFARQNPSYAPGSGYGFYNAVRFAVKMGAFIEVSSAGEDKGSTFSLIIPNHKTSLSAEGGKPEVNN